MKLPEDLSPDYRFLAIIGHPVSHSLSPLMHNSAFQALGLPYLYAMYDIEPEGLSKAVQDLKSLGFVGYNVTIPHKQAIIQHLDGVDETAKAIRAVNTVSISNNKSLGYNTDVLGIVRALEPLKNRIASQPVLVLGAGGAARAAVFALQRLVNATEITIAARSKERGASILADFKIKSGKIVSFAPAEINSVVSRCSLIVNATPVGMHPLVDDSPLSDNAPLIGGHIVFDLIYRPLETKLLRLAKKAGATAVGGLEILIQQGAAAFEIWTGKKMPLDTVRVVLEKELKTP